MKLLFLWIAWLMVACSQGQESIPTREVFQPISQKSVLELAQKEVSSGSPIFPNWNENSRVTECFPIYLEGKSEPSYFDCKVVNGTNDAGSILLNADRTDLLYVEANDTGLTLTETYRNELKRDDIRIIRYDWIRSLAIAEKSGNTPLHVDAKRVLARKGFLTNDEIKIFSDSVLSLGHNPFYSQEELTAYYQEPALISRGSADSYYASLKHRIDLYQTPNLRQFERNFKDGKKNFVGCGATAWAIVYGYWKQFKGKDRLFNGIDLTPFWQMYVKMNNPIVNQVVIACADFVQTVYGPWGGSATPLNMPKAKQYGISKGYATLAHRIDGTYFNKLDAIIAELRADRPVIMGINADGIGAITHYVVVERAERVGSDIKYTCNFGWGDYYKTIYAKGIPPKDELNEENEPMKKHSTYSFTQISM